MTSSHSEHEENGTNDGDDRPRKRRRTAYSCITCRRRKLRCDREFPACSRCVKAGHPESCVYDGNPTPTRMSTTEPHVRYDLPRNDHLMQDMTQRHAVIQSGPDMALRIATQERTIEQLQSQLQRLERTISDSAQQVVLEPRVLPQLATGLVSSKPTAGTNDSKWGDAVSYGNLGCARGKGFRLMYGGASHPFNAIQQFNGLVQFLDENVRSNPTARRIRDDVRYVKKGPRGGKGPKSPHSHGHSPREHIELRHHLLPDRETVDRLVQLFLATYENLYRILHVPSFLERYAKYWDDVEKESQFTALLLAICAVVTCIDGQEPDQVRGDSSQARETAMSWIDVLDDWIESQSHKQSTLLLFQVYCLSALAKRTSGARVKRTWMSSAPSFRFAISCGLHRDAKILCENFRTKINVFDAEMRRRIWWTIAELDLQASFDKGMPSSLAGVRIDSEAPINVEDEDLDIVMLEKPVGRDAFTRASFQWWSHRSFALRLELLTILNDSSTALKYEDVLDFDGRIHEEIAHLPSWKDAAALAPRILLELQLRQFLPVLHAPFHSLATKNPRFRYSQSVFLENAMAVIQLHAKALESAGRMLLLLRDGDIFNAALSIAAAHTKSDPGRDTRLLASALPTPSFSLLATSSSAQSPTAVLDTALSLLEKKIFYSGNAFKQYIFASSGYAFMLASQADPVQRPNAKQEEAQKSIYRISKMHYKMLSLQNEESAVALLENGENRPLYGDRPHEPQTPYSETSTSASLNRRMSKVEMRNEEPSRDHGSANTSPVEISNMANSTVRSAQPQSQYQPPPQYNHQPFSTPTQPDPTVPSTTFDPQSYSFNLPMSTNMYSQTPTGLNGSGAPNAINFADLPASAINWDLEMEFEKDDFWNMWAFDA